MTEPKNTAYLFPGQGSQFVGMGQDIYDSLNSAKAVFSMADEVLGFPLSKLCFEGPEEELRLTVNAQPALVTVAFALFEATRDIVGEALPAPAFLAGHSLGEYTALAIAGVLDFAAVVSLARERGRLMHEAGLKNPGGMAAVIGLDENKLLAVCRRTETFIANFNSPGQQVISGARENLDRAAGLSKEAGASRVIPLAVSGAFHTPLMQPAVAGMRQAIASLSFNDPTTSIIANTTAEPLTTAQSVKNELITQLDNGVQWQRSIEYMINAGVNTFIEIGPGRVLSSLTRRINREVGTQNISDLESCRKLVS